MRNTNSIPGLSPGYVDGGDMEPEFEGPVRGFEVEPADSPDYQDVTPSEWSLSAPLTPNMEVAFAKLLLESCSQLARQAAADTIMAAALRDPAVYMRAVGAHIRDMVEHVIAADPKIVEAIQARIRQSLDAQLNISLDDLDKFSGTTFREEVVRVIRSELRSEGFGKRVREVATKLVREAIEAEILAKAGGRERLQKDTMELAKAAKAPNGEVKLYKRQKVKE